MSSSTHRLRTLFRLCFLALLGFELANSVQLIHFSLSYTWLGLLITITVIWAVIELVQSRLVAWGSEGLSWTVWALSLISICIDAGGDIMHWYDAFDWYDRVAHSIGGFVTVFIIWNIVRAIINAKRIQLPAFLTPFLAYCITLSLGCIYEIEEYLEDVFTGSHRSGGSIDTADDLLMNFLGAGVAFACIWYVTVYRKRRRFLQSAPLSTK